MNKTDELPEDVGYVGKLVQFYVTYVLYSTGKFMQFFMNIFIYIYIHVY